jgi:hypothetical protein
LSFNNCVPCIFSSNNASSYIFFYDWVPCI